MEKRSLPWREEPTPYHVWVSEIMLQQTRVEAVKPFYERFLKAFPSIEALANAEEGQTPLQLKLSQLSKILTWLVLGICVVIFIVQILRAGGLNFEGVLNSFNIVFF